MTAPAAMWYLRRPDDFHWLDAVDLPIHETGHLVFAWGGEFLSTLGGTLFQLIVPLVFVGYFWRRGDRHAATIPRAIRVAGALIAVVAIAGGWLALDAAGRRATAEPA